MFVISIILILTGATFLLTRSLLRDNLDVPSGFSLSLGGGLTATGALLAVLSTVSIVDPGYRGVVVVFGQIQSEPLDEGFHFVNPFATVHMMDVRVRNSIEKQNAQTSDTQSIGIQVILNWRPDSNGVVDLYQNYGLNYADIIIPQAVTESVKGAIASKKLTELTSERAILSSVIVDAINTTLNKYHINVLECGLGQIDFSEKYDAAIEEKQRREQEALQREYELDATRTEAQMAEAKSLGLANSRIAEANGLAESMRLQAQAEADALLIRGQAQADYNQKLAESLTPLLIQQEWLARWNGVLPTMILGENTAPMLMIPSGSR